MPESPIFRGFFAMQASKPLFDAGLERSGAAKPLPRVVLETTLGELVVEIDTTAAPVTAANFLRYVTAGAYDGGQFHRTVTPENQPDNEIRIGVIQGSARNGAAAYPAIVLERTSISGLSHLHGTISMARTEADSATEQFFPCVGDQPGLDFGGRRNADGQALQPPVQIVRARRL
jgi:peptidyl-prolyl cis-trans isomerase A (cyclophilin A)